MSSFTPVKSLYLIVVHGVGEQTSGFADKLIRNVSEQAARHKVATYCRPVLWAPLMDLTSTRFLKSAKKFGTSGNMTQKLVVNTLSDALAYRSDRPVGQQIFNLLDYEVTKLRGEPVHFIGHSLGALILTDYLKSRTGIRVGSMNTCGANIPLFQLGAPAMELAKTLQPNGRPWRNYYYDSDMLGFPLRTLPELQHVQDVKLDDAGGLRWSRIVPGLAHVDYFGDAAWHRRLAQDLIRS